MYNKSPKDKIIILLGRTKNLTTTADRNVSYAVPSFVAPKRYAALTRTRWNTNESSGLSIITITRMRICDNAANHNFGNRGARTYDNSRQIVITFQHIAIIKV